jgi:replicative DNA helicase
MVAGSDNKIGNREQEISTISRSLKAIAKELSIPIIALSQLSRAVETRGSTKRPQLSDLRESGAIEQDADLVMFIYRPEYYGLTEDESAQSTQGIAEVSVAKNRNGALKTVNLRFISHLTKFTDLDSYDFVDESLTMAPRAIEPDRVTRRSRLNDMEDEPPF